jgi:hypothetical protein
MRCADPRFQSCEGEDSPGKEDWPPQIFVGQIAEFYQGTQLKPTEEVNMKSFREMQNEIIWESMVHRQNNPLCCL